MTNARGIYKEANEALRGTEEKEERMMLLEAWKDFEVINQQGWKYVLFLKKNIFMTKKTDFPRNPTPSPLQRHTSKSLQD